MISSSFIGYNEAAGVITDVDIVEIQCKLLRTQR